jgi:ribonuclease E
LRQDDITSDHLQASYKLVEKPEESKTVAASAQEAAKAAALRPQAAVRGITPAQPAPKHEVKVENKIGLIGSLVAWLKSLGGESEPAKPAAPARGNRNNPRRERSEGGNKQRRERGESGNKPRRDRDDAQRAESANKEQQPNRTERQQRPPRPPKNENTPVLETPKPVLNKAEGVVPAEQEGEANGNREGGRKRGRRGGRRERERRDQPATGLTNENQAVEAVPTIETVAAPVEAMRSAAPAIVKPTEYIAYPDSMKRLTPTEVVCYPAQPAQVAQVAAPVMASIDLSGSGLTMIETDPSKAASVVAAIPESRKHAPRRRERQREIYTAENSEPLQQVETHMPN